MRMSLAVQPARKLREHASYWKAVGLLLHLVGSKAYRRKMLAAFLYPQSLLVMIHDADCDGSHTAQLRRISMVSNIVDLILTRCAIVHVDQRRDPPLAVDHSQPPTREFRTLSKDLDFGAHNRTTLSKLSLDTTYIYHLPSSAHGRSPGLRSPAGSRTRPRRWGHLNAGRRREG
ncbi:hypothetical protein K456DRAFT_375077 [Colletotrichum gloeosporioides 23]|nr:hypothetical protein K456DRAFT_375077 [Colletotrichum gloeosporioides 23]